MALVKVGAMFVNSIELLHERNKLFKKVKRWHTLHLAQQLFYYLKKI